MPTEQFANNASTTITGAMSAIQTSLTVGSNDNFPAVTTASTNFFYIVIGTEIMKVTNNPTTTWTVSRGEQGSIATTHNAGDTVYCVVTKQSLLDLGSDIVTSGVIASLPTFGNLGNVYLPTNSFYNAILDTGASWSYFLDGKVVTPPLAASNWTLVTGGNATLTDSSGGLYLSTASNTISNAEAALRAVPGATPYTITMKLVPNFLTNVADQPAFGVCFTNGTTVASAISGIRFYSTPTSNFYHVVQSASWTSFAFAGIANNVEWTQCAISGPDLWFRLSNSGTTKTMSVSKDGINFLTVATLATATPFTPTHYGFFGTVITSTGRAWSLTVPSVVIS